MQRLAQGPFDPRGDARLLGDLALGAGSEALARLEVSLGQVPAAVAADHQPLPAVVHHHAPGRLDRDESGGESPEGGPGIGRDDRNGVVRFENFEYLVAVRAALRGHGKPLRIGCGGDEPEGLIGEINGRIHRSNGS